MITKEVYVEIEVLRKHGFSLRRIAVEVGCAVNTVRSHLAKGDEPRYQRQKKRATKLAGYESYLRERQAAAQPHRIPATVLQAEIVALGYAGGISQLRAFLREIRPATVEDSVVRFETAPGEQLQIDWVEFRQGANPLYAFCATLGYSRASHVEFVTDMKVGTLIDCHQLAFAAFGGVARQLLYDNMKTVVLERGADESGEHRYHAGFLDYAKHCGFAIRLCRPYRARTKGKVERFNGYLRRSFYIPLVARLKQAGLQLDAVTANAEVRRWLKEVANERLHGTTQAKPAQRLQEEQGHLQGLPPPWRGDIAAARPLAKVQPAVAPATASPTVAEHLESATPAQHPLAVYQKLLAYCLVAAEVTP
ncbi:MAG: IS21 family transposase [Candidatus Accumulibacter sp.]|uniref:IS21 family transposase n=1 Tax=Accumulibacter sp. TaxID=2053492 RepID=UPI001B087113|nr:IS21 family transposase [Accumulibacter sp.]MBO3704472.1 IS21 family transposase [Accumulibacter sp.]